MLLCALEENYTNLKSTLSTDLTLSMNQLLSVEKPNCSQTSSWQTKIGNYCFHNVINMISFLKYLNIIWWNKKNEHVSTKTSGMVNLNNNFQFHRGRIRNTCFEFLHFLWFKLRTSLGPPKEKHFQQLKWYVCCNVSFGFLFHQNRIEGGISRILPIFGLETGTFKHQWKAIFRVEVVFWL